MNNDVRFSEIKIKKNIPAPVSLTWHEISCFICMENFNEKRPRVMFWSCRHNTCFECYEHLVSRKIMNCTYCNSKHINISMSVEKYTSTKLPDGQYIHIPLELVNSDCKLYKDDLQKNIILNTNFKI
jgi:hypothetical protein